MGMTDRLWDAITTVIRMNDKIEGASSALRTQQARIENLTERVIRLEATLELLSRQGPLPPAPPLLGAPEDPDQ